MALRFILALLISLSPALAYSEETINLTPAANNLVVGKGRVVLPKKFRINCRNCPDSIRNEAVKLKEAIETTTDIKIKICNSAKNEFINLSHEAATYPPEGYRLEIVANKGIRVSASTSAGFFYAFQTIKKLLSPNVAIGVNDKREGKDYYLPAISVNDSPRFAYRGFMLDVSRHFFPVKEIKRLLDVMAVYKMNRFHWHLTDDQGWRAQIKAYPKLTKIGSVAEDIKINSGEKEYWLGKPYGPYFYTQDEMREVVRYAKDRHIEVIPEIDMPGHFTAAMAAYPEYSCTPKAKHKVWTQWGISGDVLNVGNPAAVDFAKAILKEIASIFPSEYIHIGGDECPTDAWKGNVQCRALYESKGMSSYSQLQSLFIKQMADYLSTLNKKIIVWNEAITADGADINIIKRANATVFCWYPAKKAARITTENGLNCVFTPIGPYYINRKQSKAPNEPIAAGNGSDDLRSTYQTEPVPSSASPYEAKHYIGVQATFWTEHVSDAEYLEYLALPRLMAVAESGWSRKENKDFENFRKRMTLDSKMLDLKNYKYGRHFIY